MRPILSHLRRCVDRPRPLSLLLTAPSSSSPPSCGFTSKAFEQTKVEMFHQSVEYSKRFDPGLYQQLGCRVFKSCAMYAQKPGLLDDVGPLLKPQGQVCGVVTQQFMDDKYGERLVKSLAGSSIESHKVLMGKEASWEEIYHVVHALQDKKLGFVIALGGGKVMDVARISAHIMGIPHVVIPTLASTDAAGTATAVVYHHDTGKFREFFHLPTSPSVVLMDSSIIAESPLRFTVAGLGDALSTYYEARAVRASGGLNLAGGLPCGVAWAIASSCRDIILESGPTAVQDLKANPGKVTPALDRVIEANTLLSGVGASASGLACAHALHDGLTSLPQVHDNLMHGEIVAWTTLVQLVLEGDSKEAEKIARFNRTVGLPVTFKDMHMEGMSRDLLVQAAELACAPTQNMKNMPFPVNPIKVVESMKGADYLGRHLK